MNVSTEKNNPLVEILKNNRDGGMNKEDEIL